MTHQTSVDEGFPLDYEQETEDEWLEEAPPRPRRKLLSPFPVTLFTILALACGFFAGVEVEKGQSSGSGGGLPSGFAASRSRLEAGSTRSASSTGGSSSGFPGAGRRVGGQAGGLAPSTGAGFPGAGGLAGGPITTGEVSFTSGSTLYVTDSEGGTVRVSAPEGTKVSKTVTSSVRSIHPGDTVLVRGSRDKKGNVSASSITVSSSTGSNTGASTGSSTSASTTPQLFGAG